jgi:hypothetical protein
MNLKSSRLNPASLETKIAASANLLDSVVLKLKNLIPTSKKPPKELAKTVTKSALSATGIPLASKLLTAGEMTYEVGRSSVDASDKKLHTIIEHLDQLADILTSKLAEFPVLFSNAGVEKISSGVVFRNMTYERLEKSTNELLTLISDTRNTAALGLYTNKRNSEISERRKSSLVQVTRL